MNGGTSNSQSITGYQMAAINNAIKIDLALQIQTRVINNIKIIVYYVIATLLFLCLIIITLIVNLVIVKYQKIIAVMKVLGYKDSYILKIFVGMYLPIVVVTTILGFILGVVVMSLVTTNMTSSGIVLPLFIFTWWYPIATLLIVWIIYTSSSITSWEILKRIRLLIAVQES
ncbi:ABC transporter permease [Spiroplasma clarkii]|uniref:FtsX-like permease family protein n=1 Tax=Spiroplasma clarkii TaxID=2139 RepID=UPI000B5851F2|nr:FtsX-like permease family protein [Spiroplasma clarkii]ARU91317.1 ABC transporter permease [Spiroplasma clarkii]